MCITGYTRHCIPVVLLHVDHGLEGEVSLPVVHLETALPLDNVQSPVST